MVYKATLCLQLLESMVMKSVADYTQKGLMNRNICSLGFYIFHFILFSVENLLHSHEIRRGFNNNVVTRVCV